MFHGPGRSDPFLEKYNDAQMTAVIGESDAQVAASFLVRRADSAFAQPSDNLSQQSLAPARRQTLKNNKCVNEVEAA